ncbi:MAG: type II toxin-antitoxin system HipA family toxin [Spirochaetales bacterium]|nr:type II toxin-antitoxin system HipA family toxin [Spirochaetales bacterium]
MSKNVRVTLWGTTVGYLGYSPGQQTVSTFEYDPGFLESGIQISPIHLRYPPSVFSFNQLSFKSFRGVPGFIADSLPDKYGNQLIDIYMADKNIPPSGITTLDRLLYVSARGMGALEYHPGETLPLQRTALDLQNLSELAEMVLKRKDKLHDKLLSAEDRAEALTLIRIGSSAGGARSKALIALSSNGTLLDGTVSHGPDYSYWILKFDSGANKDRDNSDPKGMPAVEFIYSLIARKSGIDIPKTKLWIHGENRHFLIERFDRIVRNRKVDKLHYVSWAGLAHADRDGVNSYEQLILLVRQLNLGQAAVTEIFRRAVFNILGRNQDDHTKNFGFLMDRSGQWSLAPAFDLTYSYDPFGHWTKNHQSWLNNKNNNFKYDDLLKFGVFCGLNTKKSHEIIYQIKDAFSHFSVLASEYELESKLRETIESNLRLAIVPLQAKKNVEGII